MEAVQMHDGTYGVDYKVCRPHPPLGMAVLTRVTNGTKNIQGFLQFFQVAPIFSRVIWGHRRRKWCGKGKVDAPHPFPGCSPNDQNVMVIFQYIVGRWGQGELHHVAHCAAAAWGTAFFSDIQQLRSESYRTRKYTYLWIYRPKPGSPGLLLAIDDPLKSTNVWE